LDSDEEIKIVVDVTISGEEISGLCDTSELDNYKLSLLDVFIAASGVSNSDVKEVKLTCNTNNGDVVLTYNMLSENSRSRNTVTQRINSGEFLSTYQSNLNLVYNDVEAKSATLVEADRTTKEKSDDDPFKNFFAAHFGLGVVILVVSVLWCFLLRANEGDVDQIRLKQLREEKRRFEEKYGAIEEDSVEAAERDIPKAVELADTTKTSTKGEETKPQPTQTQPQVQVQAHVHVQVQVQKTEKETTYGESKEPETKPAETAYRASVVNEVKHVGKQEERASLDLDQIKDPGKKRRKTQEYLNTLWDDKTEAKEAQANKDEDGSEEEEEEEEEESEE